MTYKEQLQTARDNKLDVLDLTVANEVYYYFEHHLITDELFEQLCEFVTYIYLKSEHTLISDIVGTIHILVTENDYTFDDIFVMDKWDFLSQVTNYFPY